MRTLASFKLELLTFALVVLYLIYDLKWDSENQAVKMREMIRAEMKKRNLPVAGDQSQRTTAQNPVRRPKRDIKKRYVRNGKDLVDPKLPVENRNPSSLDEFNTAIRVHSPSPSTVIDRSNGQAFRIDGDCSASTVTIRLPGKTRYAVCQSGSFYSILNLLDLPDGNIPITVVQLNQDGQEESQTTTYFKTTDQSGDTPPESDYDPQNDD